MTVEIISLSISRKVWNRAEIEIMTPGSAVGLTTDCATGPRTMEFYKGIIGK